MNGGLEVNFSDEDEEGPQLSDDSEIYDEDAPTEFYTSIEGGV